MNRHLHCLCDQNTLGCEICLPEAEKQRLAFAGQYPQDTPGQLMQRAIEAGRAYVVLGILQQPGFDINAPCEPGKYGTVSPLMVALEANDPQITSLIMGQPELDLDQSLSKYDTWSWARSASLDLLKLFLSYPAVDVNRQDGNGRTLLHEIVQDPKGTAKLELLLTQDDLIVDVRQNDGTTPFYRAVLAGNVEAVDLLLQHPVDVNNRNNDNLWTILMVAVAANQAAVVEKLLQQPHIDVNAQSDRGETALHMAAARGFQPLAALLLDHPDIQVNLKDHAGWTALHRAVQNHQSGVLKLLLARPDLNVNLVDGDRQTALHWAVLSSNPEAIRLLLDHPDLNMHITNRPAQETAAELASSLEQAQEAEMIRMKMEANPGEDKLSSQDDYEDRDREEPPIKRTKPRIGDPPLPF